MMAFLREFNDEQRKLTSDLFATTAKLFVGGGLVSPFLNQAEIGVLGAALAVCAGLVFHLVALYIQRSKDV